MVGLAGVFALAAWLWLVGGLSVAGVFENQDAGDVVRGKWLEVAGGTAALGALVSLAGLAVRLRLPTAMGAVAVVVSSGALFLAWLANGWHLGQCDDILLLALLASASVGVLAYRAVYPRAPERRNDLGP
jgi:hypothetical protein